MVASDSNNCCCCSITYIDKWREGRRRGEMEEDLLVEAVH